jgi:beta-N-acetylhexosaminidase
MPPAFDMNHADPQSNARQIVASLELPQLCGQLLVVGFDGSQLPSSVADAIRTGRRGGLILFKRNLPDITSAWRLCRSIRDTFPTPLPALIGIDEEGGKVGRLPAPFQRLPPMRWFGQRDDPKLTYRAAKWLGKQLAALGFTCNFAPVLDVDSNPLNPIIGDRSFSDDPAVVTRHALAFVAGLQEQGVAACGKHFPGHGDTSVDSHVALPTVERSRNLLERIELAPFRGCASAGLAAIMTAHVVYPQLDGTRTPATFSQTILTGLLRNEIGFRGLLFSDDLEMGAVARHDTVESAACRAVRAGCDTVLICHHESAAERAHAALMNEVRNNPTMRERVVQAATRSLTARCGFRPEPVACEDDLARVLEHDASFC